MGTTFILYPNKREYHPYVQVPNVFNNDECNKIIELGRNKEISESTIALNDKNNTLDNKIRKSKNSWLYYDEQSSWIYEKLSHLTKAVNQKFWGFQLQAFSDSIQFTEYERGHFYDWHKDFGSVDTSCRKLSIVVQLTDPKDYDGGQFEFYDPSCKPVSKERGSVIFFPSFEVHRVAPVNFGLRNSLVTWVSGEFYR